MTASEPSSELRACGDIDDRGRSSGHIALKSMTGVDVIVSLSWDVLTSN